MKGYLILTELPERQNNVNCCNSGHEQCLIVRALEKNSLVILSSKPLGGYMVNSVFHHLDVDQMSNKNSWVFKTHCLFEKEFFVNFNYKGNQIKQCQN